ncbi:MAG: hypothetical protein C4589_11265 [Peptococcaceae bacterium]|jgi:phage-related protein|nr:MAG: hypothetical protein C4589_11265 [Peptococcaceae bacterium]
MKVGELFVVLGLDPKEYQQGLRKAERDSEVFAKNVKKNLSSIGEGLKKAGQNLSLFLTVPLALVGRNMLKMASDAVESENLFEISMGNMADAARRWSDELSNALKQNRYEMRSNLGLFNSFIMNMGFGEKSAYDMARALTMLGYDLESLYGAALHLTREQVFEKLRSGLRGETEAIEVFGVNLLEANVNNYAYAHGIASVGSQLSETQKIMARYGIIMENTRKAHGDLARTIDSPANVARAREAKLAEAQVEAGKSLLEMSKKINLALGRLAEMFLRLPPGMQSAVVWMGVLTAVVGPLFYGLGMLLLVGPRLLVFFRGFSLAAIAAKAVNLLKLAVQGLFFVLTKNPIVAAVMIIATALLALAMSSKTVRDWLDQVIARLRALAGMDYSPPAMKGADPSKLTDVYDEYLKNLAGVADGTKDAKKETKKFLAAFDEVYQVSEDTGDALSDLGDMFGGIGKILSPPDAGEPPGAGGGIKLPEIPTAIPPVTWPGITPPPGAVAEVFETALERIRQAVMQPILVTALPRLIPQPETIPAWEYVLQRIKELLLQPWPVVPLPVLTPAPGLIPLWENARQGVSTAIDWIKQKASEFKLPDLAPLPAWVPSWQTVTAGIVAAWQAGKDNLSKLTQDTWNTIKSHYDQAKEFVSPGVQNALSWIKQMWEGHKGEILVIAGLIVVGIIAAFAGLPASVIAAVAVLLPRFGTFLQSLLPKVSQFIPQVVAFFAGLPGRIINSLATLIPRLGREIFSYLPGVVQKAIDKIPGIFTNLIPKALQWGKEIISNLINGIKSMHIPMPHINVTAIARRITEGLSIPIPQFAVNWYGEGGIFTKPSVIGVGEREDEAVLPLSKLNELTQRGNGDIHLHVGVLVADDRGLKELERRLKSIRFSEAARGAMT